MKRQPWLFIKKELNGQIRSVGVDCEKKLEATIDPLNPSSHPSSGIINVISGKITVTVNVDQALRIGEEQMKKFENSWPEEFNSNIQKHVQTLAVERKHIQVESAKLLYDTNVIYSCLIGLQASQREVKLDEVLKHELAPVPTSVFGDEESQD